MIVKNFNHGKGKCSSAINYLLDIGDREIAPEVIQGIPELTAEIADNLNYKHKYLSGVLAFNETDLSEKAIAEITKSFEEELVFPSMNKEKYNILWVKHQDKNNLELHYIIPSVDLENQKQLSPYFHKVDKHRWRAWQEITNDKYNLSTPDDPRRSQKLKIDFSQSRSLKDLKEDIKQIIEKEVTAGEISNREGVLKLLLEYDVEITRKGKDYISLKRPEDKKAFRLKGDYFKEDWKREEVTSSVYENWKRERPQQIEKYRQTFMVGTEKRIEKLNKRYIKKEVRIEPRVYTDNKRELAGHEKEIRRTRKVGDRLSGINEIIRSGKRNLKRISDSFRAISSNIERRKRELTQRRDRNKELERARERDRNRELDQQRDRERDKQRAPQKEKGITKTRTSEKEDLTEYHQEDDPNKMYHRHEVMLHRSKQKFYPELNLKPLDPRRIMKSEDDPYTHKNRDYKKKPKRKIEPQRSRKR